MRRFCDIVLSVCALAVLLPVLAIISVAILFETGRPVLFRQTRTGRHGRPFRILKFRSMWKGSSGASVTTGGDPRITRTGRFLRRYKLDELPQLWNVLRGDMSLIGPRPEVPQFVDMSDPVWVKVLSVRPGITELASLVYRDEETLLTGVRDTEEYYRSTLLPAKLHLNVRYIDERTVRTDLTVLLFTLGCSFLPRVFDHRRVLNTLLPQR